MENHRCDRPTSLDSQVPLLCLYLYLSGRLCPVNPLHHERRWGGEGQGSRSPSLTLPLPSPSGLKSTAALA